MSFLILAMRASPEIEVRNCEYACEELGEFLGWVCEKYAKLNPAPADIDIFGPK